MTDLTGTYQGVSSELPRDLMMLQLKVITGTYARINGVAVVFTAVGYSYELVVEDFAWPNGDCKALRAPQLATDEQGHFAITGEAGPYDIPNSCTYTTIKVYDEITPDEFQTIVNRYNLKRSPPGCQVSDFSSRVCECGTIGCDVVHQPYVEPEGY